MVGTMGRVEHKQRGSACKLSAFFRFLDAVSQHLFKVERCMLHLVSNPINAKYCCSCGDNVSEFSTQPQNEQQ